MQLTTDKDATNSNPRCAATNLVGNVVELLVIVRRPHALSMPAKVREGAQEARSHIRRCSWLATNDWLGSILVAMQLMTDGDATNSNPRCGATNLVGNVVELHVIVKRPHALSVPQQVQEGAQEARSHIRSCSWLATNDCLGSILVAMQPTTEGHATNSHPRCAVTNLVPDAVELLVTVKRPHALSVPAKVQEGAQEARSHIRSRPWLATSDCKGTFLVAMQLVTDGDATNSNPRCAATNLVPDVVELLVIVRRPHAPFVPAKLQEGARLARSHIRKKIKPTTTTTT